MIINVYKPKDWTSFDVVAKVRGIFRELEGKKVKVGHAGTLDPLASGVLIVLTHNDTKRQQEFMQMEKEYRAEIAFGVWSETYDLEGSLQTDENFLRSIADLSELESKINAVLNDFTGEIEQTVPPYSAVKVAGKALYKKARAGMTYEIQLPVKRITIYDIHLESLAMGSVSDYGHSYELPVLTATIRCSSGTYIRSLAHDLGIAVGTKAVLAGLERTCIGEYSISDSVKIEELKARISGSHAQ